MASHYFATDGNYGNAEGLVVVSTDGWSDDDWEKIETAGDYERAEVAREIEREKTA